MRIDHLALACVLTTGAATALVACTDGDTDTDVHVHTDDTDSTARYALSSIVITDSGRTLYVQVVDALGGSFDNATALEVAGNAILEVQDGFVYTGLVEEPTWVRYAVGADGALVEDGRISFAAYGWEAIDYGNVMVDSDTAVSINTALAQAIIWDPSAMTITGTVDLPQLPVEGFSAEVWTTTAHDGLVYIPGRHANWTQGQILHQTMMTVLDPDQAEIVAVLSDERCPNAGRMIFAPDGTGYVMSDGRNYSIQMFARARGASADEVPRNCFLRVSPGASSFDADWSVDVVDVTDGREVLTELLAAEPDTGVAFAKVFYEDRLPEGIEPTSFDFWGEDIGAYWRFDLTQDPPVGEKVDGVPFSGIGFTPNALDGKLIIGESIDGGARSQVLSVDPETNAATELFTMDGYFNGVFRL